MMMIACHEQPEGRGGVEAAALEVLAVGEPHREAEQTRHRREPILHARPCTRYRPGEFIMGG